MTPKTILLLFHVLGVIFGVGGVLMLDIDLVRLLRGSRITAQNVAMTKFVSTFVKARARRRLGVGAPDHRHRAGRACLCARQSQASGQVGRGGRAHDQRPLHRDARAAAPYAKRWQAVVRQRRSGPAFGRTRLWRSLDLELVVPRGARVGTRTERRRPGPAHPDRLCASARQPRDHHASGGSTALPPDARRG